MSFLKDIIDKQRLKRCLELLKSHVATSVNGNKPDSNGAVNVDVGVKTIDSITPDEEGNVKIPVATDEEVEAGEVDNKYMTPANTLFAINKRTANFYNSVADMKADKKLKAGMTACTLGYYEPNDGGAGTYIIRAKQDGDVDDGGSLHEISSKLVAELVVENGTINVKQFGAKGDGVSDDKENFLNAIKANNNIYIPCGTYYVSKLDISDIKKSNPVTIHSSTDAIINMASGIVCDKSWSQGISINLYNIKLVGNNTSDSSGIFIHSGIPIIIHRCTIMNFNKGIQLQEVYRGEIKEVVITDCNIGIEFFKGKAANSVNGFIVTDTSISNATQGIVTDVGANNTFKHVSFESCTSCFVLNNSPSNYIIKECYAEGKSFQSFVIITGVYSSNIHIINNFIGYNTQSKNTSLISIQYCVNTEIMGNIVKLNNQCFFLKATACSGLVTKNILRNENNSEQPTTLLYSQNYLPMSISESPFLKIDVDCIFNDIILSYKEKTVSEFNSTVPTSFITNGKVMDIECFTPSTTDTIYMDTPITTEGWYTASFLVNTSNRCDIILKVAEEAWIDTETRQLSNTNGAYVIHSVTRYFNANEKARIGINANASIGFIGFIKNGVGLPFNYSQYLINKE